MGSKGNLVSFLQLGLIIPFPTRRLLFSLKRRASFLLGYFPIRLGTWMTQNIMPQHIPNASQALSRKMLCCVISLSQGSCPWILVWQGNPGPEQEDQDRSYIKDWGLDRSACLTRIQDRVSTQHMGTESVFLLLSLEHLSTDSGHIYKRDEWMNYTFAGGWLLVHSSS